MEITETTKEKHYVYEGRIIKVRNDIALLPNGKEVHREVVEHNGGVTILAITDNDEVLFVKQFRYPYYKALLELPAGKLEGDAKPFFEGIRELKEETGAVAKTYFDLGIMYPSPGYSAEIIYIYAAKDLEFFEQNLDEDEFVNVEKIPYDKAIQMVLNGEISDGKTSVALLKYEMLKKTGKLEEAKISVEN